jgi:sialate O-acetylesterase
VNHDVCTGYLYSVFSLGFVVGYRYNQFYRSENYCVYYLVDGAVRFANYYQDHMVLQRAPQRAIIWGYADSFNALTILTVNNKIYRTRTSSSAVNELNESVWSVMLDAQTQEGPFQVKVTHTLPNGTLVTIDLNDVLFGDVWVCSGQSNMGFAVLSMYNASIEIQNAGKYPKVRLFTAAKEQSDTPLEELKSIALNWSVASPQSVGSPYASAVCWLYGRMIHEGLGGRPIGLVHTSWGGTPIELWSPPSVLRDCGIPK